MLVLGGLLGTGCQTNRPKASSGAEGVPLLSEAGEGNSVQAAPTNGEPVIIPITSPTGVVATVNDPLRFVVLDYALSNLPKLDQRLFIYRRGQKVAEVKVTGPFRGQTVAADIIEGIAAAGDEVRAE